jgi:hypothetical protein
MMASHSTPTKLYAFVDKNLNTLSGFVFRRNAEFVQHLVKDGGALLWVNHVRPSGEDDFGLGGIF